MQSQKQGLQVPKSALRILAYLAAFMMPIILVVIILYWLQLYPFGEDNLSTWDLRITYSYFYEWFKQVLAGDGNIFYSFSKSLGGNMYAGFTCLLTSPINWLIPLFGDNPVDFITFSITVKFGFAGLSAFYYLTKRFSLQWYLRLALSICYSMSLFLTTQSGNPMWMEAVIVLPLVMYGIFLLVNQGKVVLFFIWLLISIILNFYNGYMICLFSILFYLYESYLAAPNAQRVRLRIMVNPGRFAATYTLAIAASVVILLPTVIGLMGGKGSVPDGLFTPGLRYDPANLIDAFYLGIYHKEVLPQLFTGTFVTIGTLWFFLNSSTPKRERIAMGIILAVMLLSTLYAPLERFWLGLRDGNSFYCRFAFLITFLLFFCTASVLSTSSGDQSNNSMRQLKKSVLTVAIVGGFVYGSEIYQVFYGAGLPLSHTFVYFALLGITLLLCIYFWIFLTKTANQNSGTHLKHGLGILLILVIAAEMTVSGNIALKFRAEQETQTGYTEYQDYFTAGHSLMAELDSQDDSAANAFRVEKNFNFLSRIYDLSVNETLAFGYHGLASYDSAYDDIVQNMLYRLGYTPDSYIRTTFHDSMIVADSLIGIEYMIMQERPLGYTNSNISGIWNGASVYQNPYVLPLGFGADRGILNTVAFDGNPFNYQNQIVSELLGQDTECLVKVDTELIKETPDTLTWKVKAPESGEQLMFGFIEGESYTSLSLLVSDELRYSYLNEWSQGMFPIANKTSDGNYTVSVQGNRLNDASDFILHVVYLDKTLFASAVEQLASRPFNIEVFDDGYVYGTYQAQDKEVLFTTIPWDVGWTIKVNGAVVTPHLAQDAFIALDLSPGLNQIEMSYISPGFIPGAVISIISCVVFIALAIFLHRKDRVSIIDKPQHFRRERAIH